MINGRIILSGSNRSIAQPGFSRWLVPPAALSIHLAIGQVYAFSVFKKPLNYLVQVSTVGWRTSGSPRCGQPEPGRLEIHGPWLDLQHRHRLPGHIGRGLRQVAGKSRAAQGHVRLGRAVSAAVSSSPHWAFTSTNSGSFISATA